MKYMNVFTIRPENQKAARERFMKGDVVLPGVKLLGRWFETGTGRGFNLIETDDPAALTKYGLYWNDLIDMRAYPVVDDAQMIAALK
jgi:hypothetical protein